MKNSRKFRSDIAKKILATVLAGLSLTGGIQNVIAMGPIGNIQKNTLDKNNFWNESAQNSNKEFIKGYGNNESGILNEIKKFIVNDSVNFDDLKNFGFSSITDLYGNGSSEYGVKCRIGELKNEEKGFRKAIVFIVVPDGGILTQKSMDYIKGMLKSQNFDADYYKKDVNFIIRSQSRSNKFKIEEMAIIFCKGATINVQGATISSKQAIYGCGGATINFQGTTISAEDAIDNCYGATINLEGATISSEQAIYKCDGAKINLEGARILAKYAIYWCEGATINLQGATISAEYAIGNCYRATINLQGATIPWKIIIYQCPNSKITVDEDKAYYVKWIVDKSANIKINNTPIIDLKKNINKAIKKIGEISFKTYKNKKSLYEKDIEKFEKIAGGKTFRVDENIRDSEPYDTLHMSISKITDILTEYSVLSKAIKIIKSKLSPSEFWLKLIENKDSIIAGAYYDLSISLNDKYFGRYFDETIPEKDMSFKSSYLDDCSDGWHSPVDEDKVAFAPISHEMGHILEFVYIYVKGMKEGKNTTHDEKMAKEIKNDIIAKAGFNSEDCYISRGSKKNDYEFFAECFAALQCCINGRDSLDSGKKALIKATKEYINEKMIPELEKFVEEHEPKKGCTIV